MKPCALWLAAFALLASACATADESATAPAAAAPAPAAQPVAGTQSSRLRQLFHESDEATLRRNPLSAMFRGDFRYADRLGDGLTDAYYAAERAAAQEALAALAAIDRDSLGETDRLAYDVFKYQREDDLADLSPEILALTAVRPVNHFSGFHTFYPVFASGRNAAPFRNVEDYENNLRRHRQFVEAFDRVIARFREGLASGVVETKLTVQNVIGQLDTQLNTPPEDSPYAGPVRTFPDAVPEAERARLREAHIAI